MTDTASGTTDLKAAISTALDATRGQHRDRRIDAIHTAIQGEITKLIPAAVKAAVESTATTTALAEQIVSPVLRELEDAISEEHDATTTPDRDRPGLRRAGRIARGIRRTIEEEASR